MTNVTNRREYLNNIDSYLLELEMLADLKLSKDDLSSLKEVENIRDAALNLKSSQSSKFEIDFIDKSSDRFVHYIQNICQTNDDQVYLWTSKTNSCGLYKVDSISHVNFSFPFEINKEGVLVFLTADVNDKLLLDFTIDDAGKKVIEVETQGLNWPSVEF